jgi:glycosyltransferase involved in cell wall biosynthesis
MNNVSVIIPVYNEIHFIQKTLESVVGEADEIILSDNASTDGTSDICITFANKYPEIKYYRQKENLFAADNLLFCINKVNRKFIRIIGGHDMIWPGSTKKMLAIINENEKAVVVYQNHSLYFNPNYTINRYFTTNDLPMEQGLESDNVFERVKAILYGTFDGAMFYSLYRTESLVKSFSKHNFCSSLPTDQGLIAILAKEGKILTEKETAGLFMIPRSMPKTYNEEIEYLKKEVSRVTDKISHPYAFRFAIFCERYSIAKELEVSGMAPDNLAYNTIKHLVNSQYIVNPSLLKEGCLYISDDRDDIRKEVLSIIEREANKKKLSNNIKRYIKYFVPFGLLVLFRKIIKCVNKDF